MQTAEPRPLARLEVLSLAGFLPGPFACRLLADLGANITVVERPGGGDPLRLAPDLHAAVTRGFRSVSVDFTDPEEKRGLLALGESADVVLEGFRPGVMNRLGLGADDFRAVNPDIVYVSISGYGQTGPAASHPGHDLMYQAVSGALHDHVTPGRDEVPTIPWADLAGSLFTVIGVVTAVAERARGGPSRNVDVSLTDALTAMLGPAVASIHESADQIIPPTPGYGVYRTADDVPVAISVVHEDALWDDLCRGLRLDQLVGTPLGQRWQDAHALDEAIRTAVRGLTWTGLSERFPDGGVPLTRVRSIHEVVDDPHHRERRVVRRDRDGRVVMRQALRFDDAALEASEEPPPDIGPGVLEQRTP
jgi:crotonobetainyl-CoA:carnitine CoA-transferase CaiB-like acyl-CoA transferase